VSELKNELVSVEELEAQFVDVEFDETSITLGRQLLLDVAAGIGERRAEYANPDHPDFQATHTALGTIVARRMLPVEFPKLGGIPMDGGKTITIHAPVKPDVELSARSRLHGIYDKKGRSGRMIFIVIRMDLWDPQENHLATIDSKLVVREKS
jgi:hypothetical protein